MIDGAAAKSPTIAISTRDGVPVPMVGLARPVLAKTG
jgi:hypothetical protein